MVRLTCQCLNVNLHVKGSNPSYIEDKAVSLGSLVGEDEDSKNLHYLKLWEVTLDVAGASVKLSPLLTVQSVGSWHLYKCCNCDSYTHLVEALESTSSSSSLSSSSLRALVTNRMEYDTDKIREMECLKSFSPIFKIILADSRDKEEETTQTQFRRRVSSLNYGRDDPTLKHIHQDMKAFLQEEQDAMEERIRRFEEEQRMVYAEMQARAHRERSIIFRLITAARDSTSTQQSVLACPAPLPLTSSQSILPPGVPSDHKPDTTASTARPPPGHRSPGGAKKNTTPQEQQQKKETAKKDSNVPPLSSHRRSDEDEDVFGEMDGFEHDDEDYAPFSQSDDDSAFTDDSFREDVLEDSSTLPRAVAQSVPISMPMFSRKSPKKSSAEQEEDRPPISYEKMAASIQALALSCHDTGMFGELPKPRLNSIPWRL